MKCPTCKTEMNFYDPRDIEYQGTTDTYDGNIKIRWLLECPKCHHYSLVVVTYKKEKIEMEWE